MSEMLELPYETRDNETQIYKIEKDIFNGLLARAFSLALEKGKYDERVNVYSADVFSRDLIIHVAYGPTMYGCNVIIRKNSMYHLAYVEKKRGYPDYAIDLGLENIEDFIKQMELTLKMMYGD